MPYYDYRCRDCGEVFEIQRSMSEHAAASAVACSTCGSEKTERVFTPIAIGAAGAGSSSAASDSVPTGAACGPGCGCHLN